MEMASNLAGTTVEEIDQVQRSTKKAKRDEQIEPDTRVNPTLKPRSFADTVAKGAMGRATHADEGGFEGVGIDEDGFVSKDDDDWDTASEDDDDDQEEEESLACPNIPLTKEEKIRMRYPWRQSLIIKLVGRTVGYKFLESRVRNMWQPKGSLELIDIGRDFYIARFGAHADYRKVLTEGPWVVADHYLSLRKWEPDFDTATAELHKLAVWIRLPGVAIEYFDSWFLKGIGARVGKVIKVDAPTAKVQRGQFARICVEVDLTKPLLSKFQRKGKIYHILYESLHAICFQCGCFGHAKESCPNGPKTVVEVNHEGTHELVPAKEVPTRVGKRGKEISDKFGPWMLVQKAPYRKDNRRSVGKAGPGGGEKVGNGKGNNSGLGVEKRGIHVQDSRFGILAEEEDNHENQGEVIAPLGEGSSPQSLEKDWKEIKRRGKAIIPKAVEDNNTEVLGISKSINLEHHRNSRTQFMLPEVLKNAQKKIGGGQSREEATSIIACAHANECMGKENLAPGHPSTSTNMHPRLHSPGMDDEMADIVRASSEPPDLEGNPVASVDVSMVEETQMVGVHAGDACMDVEC